MIIYGLACAHDKYYVGRTNSASRIDDHFEGNGAAWTRIHKPYKRLFSVQGDRYDEDKHVLRLMDQFGVDNVRGGSFAKVEMTVEDRRIVERLLRGANDRCFRCGDTDHFVSACPMQRPPVQEMILEGEEEEEAGIFESVIEWCCLDKNRNNYRRL